jgi:hypothetical protein
MSVGSGDNLGPDCHRGRGLVLKVGFRKALPIAIVMTLLLGGCGSGADTTTTIGPDASGSTSTVVEETTTVAETTTTTGAETTTTASEQVAGVEDIPPECVAEISAILQVFEPAVEGIDWENATIDDHLQVMMALAGTSVGETAACENVELDMTEEEGAALFLEVADQEAPGAVGYFKAILDINEALGDRQSTGECQADIAIFEDVVAGGVPFVDLPLPEQWLVLNLMGSIGFCSLQTQGELRFRPEVEEFLAGSPFAGG